MRIISLVPSITELLCDLGLSDQLVGITKFCIHPEEIYRSKTRVGGTKTVNVEKVKNLEPDLVIANKEENVKEQIEDIAQFSEVIVSDIKKIEDNIALIKMLSKKIEGVIHEDFWLNEFKKFAEEEYPKLHKSALYVIWNKPIMAAGGDTFISEILEKLGIENVIKKKKRYPEINPEELANLNPDYIFLSSEPFPFKQQHVELFEKFNRASKVYLVDGEAFSWYGTRVLKRVPYFKSLIQNLK